MVRRTLVAVVVAFVASSPARAQLDAEPKQPYQWRVVLSAKPHPLVTPQFRERLKRDVRAALQTGLGALGTVEVIDLATLPRDRWDPLWQQFDDKGFAALDAPRDLTGAKTHFLRVEYRDGQFHLETRQYDGFTGLSSPRVRASSVRGPELVGRTAGLMLDRDFGLVGTVEPVGIGGDRVKVLLRGGALGPVDGFVERGDVFAVAAVRKTNRPAPEPVRTATGKIIAPPPGSVPPPGLTSTPRDYTLLKVTEVEPDGTLRCAVLSRYIKNPLPPGGVAGYRCMKLGTVKAPVAVRLVGSDGTVERTASRVTVRTTDTDFAVVPGAGDAKDVCSFHSPTAQFRSQRSLTNVACVTVTLGSEVRQFPIPILDDSPIAIPFEVDPAKVERAAYEREVLAAASAAADARLAQTVCFEAVARLIDKQKNKDALDRAKGGYAAADAADKGLTDEHARLKEQIEKSPAAAPLLAKIDQNLTALRTYNAQLKGHIAKIDAVVKKENDPASAARDVQAEALNARITLLLSGGEVDQALAAYDQLGALVPDDATIKARRDKLAAEWKVKDDAHQTARDYLLKTWPAVATVQDFKDSLPQLRAAVDVCKRHGDKWTLRKVLAGFSTAGVKLNELVAGLDGATDADRKLLADANNAGKTLAALEVELRAFVGE